LIRPEFLEFGLEDLVILTRGGFLVQNEDL